jgi:hypothetical protein
VATHGASYLEVRHAGEIRKESDEVVLEVEAAHPHDVATQYTPIVVASFFTFIVLAFSFSSYCTNVEKSRQVFKFTILIHMGGVNHCRLHCRLAKSRGLMRRVKYGAVIG